VHGRILFCNPPKFSFQADWLLKNHWFEGANLLRPNLNKKIKTQKPSHV
jgi:hypothetical protein